jgi:hypothetical protein
MQLPYIYIEYKLIVANRVTQGNDILPLKQPYLCVSQISCP